MYGTVVVIGIIPHDSRITRLITVQSASVAQREHGGSASVKSGWSNGDSLGLRDGVNARHDLLLSTIAIR
jgi:hypothetical protein